MLSFVFLEGMLAGFFTMGLHFYLHGGVLTGMMVDFLPQRTQRIFTEEHKALTVRY